MTTTSAALVRAANIATDEGQLDLASHLRTLLHDLFIQEESIRQEADRKSALAMVQPPDASAQPVGGPLTLDGVNVVVMNWHDFKGWEVRRRAKDAGEAGLQLGYIRGPVVGTTGYFEATAVRPVPNKVEHFDSFGEGLDFLIRMAGLA